MSTPMYDLPKHLAMGVDKNGGGPCDPPDPEYVKTICWCGEEGCKKYETN